MAAFHPGEAATVVIDTAHGPLQLLKSLLALWETYGWPEDHVLAAMAQEERFQPDERADRAGAA